MAGKNEQLLVGWAEGRGKNLAKSKNRTESWATLKRILKKPHVTPESRREFDKMSKTEQDDLKAINGWISGAQCKDNHRSLKNVLPRNLLTIDVDYAPESLLDDITLGLLKISQFEAAWHSSRRHTPEAPRVRLFMPMTRKVSVDEYIAIVRFVGWKLDNTMKLVDQVSYRPAQMMFKPSCSRTDASDFFFFEQHGPVLDPDELLKEYWTQFGDPGDLSLMPKHPDEELRKRADKAEDPRTKAGVVGAFCRTYDIFAAMEKFLPGVYIPGETFQGSNPRYTYAGSTSSNGAVVYDQGLFLYSHHGHDPVCDMNVNAFDLVRIHLYGDADEKVKEGTTPGKMPSFEKMKEMLEKDKDYQSTRVSEKFDFSHMFNVDEDYDDQFQDDGQDHEPESANGSGPDDQETAGNGSTHKRPSADDGRGTEEGLDDDFGDGGSGGSDHSAGDEFGEDGDADSSASDSGESGWDDDILSDIEDVVGSASSQTADRGRTADSAAGSRHDAGAAGSSREPHAEAPKSSPKSGKRKRPEPSKKRTPREDWFKESLEFTENAEVKSTLHNVATIIQNDPRLINVIWYNEFNNNVVLRRDIRPRVDVAPPYKVRNPNSGDQWQDFHDITIRAILESPRGEGKSGYGMRVSDRDLVSGIDLAGRMTPFHPIRDYLLGLKWDGKNRLDTYLQRYLDVDDNVYHQQVGRLMLLASVTRVFEPGHKFDYAAILEGFTGIGKSWFIRAIYSDDWFGELVAKLDEPQKIAEQISGKWGVELPELSGFHKSDHNSAKAFMRRTDDDVRMAYDRRISRFPRQCVCWGTTNDKKYLRDPTGNRSYWPVVTPRMVFIDLEAVRAERDQLWAEAVEVYFAMREQHPENELPLMLHGAEANRIARELQENARSEEMHEIWANAILDWLDEPVTLRQLRREILGEEQAMSQTFSDDEISGEDGMLVRRTVYSREQAIQYALHKQHGIVTDHSSTQTIAKALEMVNTFCVAKDRMENDRFRVMGKRLRWMVRRSASIVDIQRGYEIVKSEDDDDLDCI